MALTKAQEQQKQFIQARQEAIVAEAKENGGTFSDAARIEFDALDVAFTTLTAKPKPSPRQLSGSGAALGSELPQIFLRQNTDGSYSRIGETFSDSPRQGKLTAEKLFGAAEPCREFSGVRDFAYAVNFHDASRLMVGGSIGNDPTGGFLVPQQFANEVITSTIEDSVVMPRARVVAMASDTVSIPIFDDHTHASSTIDGGLASSFTVEGGDITYESLVVRRQTMQAHKMASLVKVTNELLADAPNAESLFTGRIKLAAAWTADKSFLRGTGVGMPTGVLNDAALVTVSKETGQGATTLVYENLVKMLARLHPACWKNACWVMSPTCIPQLLNLTISVGTGGTVAPALTGSPGKWQLMTLPVIFSEKMSTLGTLGDVLLADFSQYLVGLRQEMTLDKSMHIKFASDESVWRLVMRYNGAGSWTQAFTPLNGATQSWCITLAAR